MRISKGWIVALQISAVMALLWVGAIGYAIVGAIAVLAYMPILIRDLMKSGTAGEKVYAVVIVVGFGYVIYRILEAKVL